MSNRDMKDLLVRELRDRADEVAGHPIALESVKRRAGGIRLRRRIAVSAVAAAVVAVALPTTLSVSETIGELPDQPVDQPNPSVTATQEPSEEPSKEASEEPSDGATAGPDGTVTLDLRDLSQGQAPGIHYLLRDVLVKPDGGTVQLDGQHYAVTPYAAGWLATTYAGEDRKLAFLDGDGDTSRTQDGSTFVVNASGAQLAYVTDAESVGASAGETQLVLAPTIGAESAKLRATVPATSTPVGFVEESAVVYEIQGESGSVLWTGFDGSTHRIPALIGAGGATESGGLVSGMYELSDFGSCWTVMEVKTGDRLWETCDFSLGTFSPDGRYVLGHPAYRDGIGDNELAILDARTGEVVAHYEATFEGFVSLAAWEDEDSALAVVYDEGSWVIVRVAPDGSLEAATEPVEAGELSRPFHF